MFATASSLSMPPRRRSPARMKTHWFALGQPASSQRPSGDQARIDLDALAGRRDLSALRLTLDPGHHSLTVASRAEPLAVIDTRTAAAGAGWCRPRSGRRRARR
jgi:hypothetical protein